MGLRRCLECRGKGYIPMNLEKTEAVAIIDLFPSVRVRNGVLSAICDKCSGRGFTNNFR